MNEINNLLLSSQNSNINIYNNQITSFFNYDYRKRCDIIFLIMHTSSNSI